MAIAEFWKWSGWGSSLPLGVAPLVVPTWANRGWRHRIRGDALLALAALATVFAALSGTPARELVPTLVLLPWLALWALPGWLGIALAGVNVAIAVNRGSVDITALAVVGALWFVLLVVWFQNQGWLPWVFLLAGCTWAVAAGDLVWTQRDGASLAEFGIGVLVLAGLWGVARAHRPQAPAWQGWSGGVASARSGWHATRLAIGVAAAVVELSWVVGRPGSWAVAIAVLLPWLLLAWAASAPRAGLRVWARWTFVSAISLLVVVWGQALADPDHASDLIAVCVLLWGGLAFVWMVRGRWRRWLLAGAAAVGTPAVGIWWRTQQLPTPQATFAVPILAVVAVVVASVVVARLWGVGRHRSAGRYAAFAPDPPYRAMPVNGATSSTTASARPQPLWANAVPAALLAGKQAEVAMRQIMLTRLPAGTWVLSGVTLPGLRGDLDVLVVGATGVFVLEVKYWAGRIMCGGDGHAWTRQRRGLVETVGDPAGQLQAEVAAVERFWHSHSRTPRGVGGMLIFAHPRSEVDVVLSPVVVVTPAEVEVFIRAGLHGPRLSPSEQIGLVELVSRVQPATWDQTEGVQQAWGPA